MPRERIYEEQRVQLQVRFQAEDRERLEREAERRGVSKNYLVERAVCEALDRWEKEKI
jgi:predicted HicB family RNase H-like nuclease